MDSTYPVCLCLEVIRYLGAEDSFRIRNSLYRLKAFIAKVILWCWRACLSAQQARSYSHGVNLPFTAQIIPMAQQMRSINSTTPSAHTAPRDWRKGYLFLLTKLLMIKSIGNCGFRRSNPLFVSQMPVRRRLYRPNKNLTNGFCFVFDVSLRKWHVKSWYTMV